MPFQASNTVFMRRLSSRQRTATKNPARTSLLNRNLLKQTMNCASCSSQMVLLSSAADKSADLHIWKYQNCKKYREEALLQNLPHSHLVPVKCGSSIWPGVADYAVQLCSRLVYSQKRTYWWSWESCWDGRSQSPSWVFVWTPVRGSASCKLDNLLLKAALRCLERHFDVERLPIGSHNILW